MRILTVGSFAPEGVARFRADAMERLDHEVRRLDIGALMPTVNRLATWLRFRLLAGPSVDLANRTLLETARDSGPFDMIWCDKPIFVRRGTVLRLRETGARIVSYNPDNPFGPRNDPGWRLFLKALPEYDVHVVNSRASMAGYRGAGASRVVFMPPFFEPSVHFPPDPERPESDRDIDVSFVGSPYDDRAAFVRALWRDHGIPVQVRGALWDRVLNDREKRALWLGGPVYNEAYRETIWRSKISLGFVTRSNQDSYARRWFEITGSGGFLLAERTDDGLAAFENDKEASFFGDVKECAARIARYLPDAEARAHVARAGHERAVRSGYDTDSRIRAVLGELSVTQ